MIFFFGKKKENFGEWTCCISDCMPGDWNMPAMGDAVEPPVGAAPPPAPVDARDAAPSAAEPPPHGFGNGARFSWPACPSNFQNVN